MLFAVTIYCDDNDDADEDGELKTAVRITLPPFAKSNESL